MTNTSISLFNSRFVTVLLLLPFFLSCAAGTVSTPVTYSQEKPDSSVKDIKSELSPLETVSAIIESNFSKDYRYSYILLDGSTYKTSDILRMLYIRNDYQPLWFGDTSTLKGISRLPEVIEATYYEGLDPSKYNPDAVKELIDIYRNFRGLNSNSDFKTIAATDLFLSNTVLTIAEDIFNGTGNKGRIDLSEVVQETDFDLIGYTRGTILSGSFENLISDLRPRSKVYSSLTEQLQRYREIRNNGGWSNIPDIRKLELGDRDPRVLAVKQRLLKTGDLKLHTVSALSTDSAVRNYMNDDRFDNLLFESVKQFQKRHHIAVDGIIGPVTLRAMNKPVEEKIEIIKLNLDLWRKLPRDLGDRYIIVNIPGYNLYGFENNEITLEMKVVVGRLNWSTPVFSDRMSYVVLNPDWNIPDSIFRSYVIPQARENESFMETQDITLLTSWREDAIYLDPNAIDWHEFDPDEWNIRARQEPGPMNPLGQIKFMFPNKYNVYLHDTPARGLFNRIERQFSHGCIRVEKPIELAEFVFKGSNRWSGERIAREIKSSKVTRNVSLPRPVPIHLLYFTAWAETDGTVYFINDIYDLTGV